VVARRGAGNLGCLIVILIIALGLYLAFGFGEAYFRAYQFKDSMQSDAGFAGNMPDENIKKHLAAVADSLGLPPEAGDVTIVRSQRTINITSNYDEVVELPFKKDRVIHFHTSVDSNL
jgi:hypothetical protein